MDKLKKCPFCGAIPEIEYEAWPDVNSGAYILSANHDRTCFIRQMNGTNRYGEMTAVSKEPLIKAWNSRNDG